MTQKEAKENFASKAKKIAPYIAIAFALISYLGFVGDFFRIKTADGTKTFYALASVLGDYSFSMCFLVWIGVLLPVVGIALILVNELVIKENNNITFGAASIIAIACILLFITKDLYGYKFDLDSASFALWGVWMPVFLALSAFTLVLSTLSEEQYTVADICECGMLIAMAFVLNFIKLFSMPTGGSINLQMIPLFILALRRGPIKGFLACGIIYGLLTCLTDGYGLATFPFDYLVGFGSTCILGFASKFVFSSERKTYDLFGILVIVGAGVAATVVRLFGSTVSSMVLYDYGFVDAIIYNATYIPLQGLFALVFLVAIYGPLQNLNKLYPVR